MSKVIESFLIALGFEVDDKGIKQTENAFNSLTAQALALGAVAAGVKIRGLVDDFANNADKLGKFNDLTGISAETVDALGYALEREGGAADGAFSALEKMMELMRTPFTGEDGWMEQLARAGIVNPQMIMEARSAEEALAALAAQMQSLSKAQQVQAGRALGLDDATIRLLSKGTAGMREYMREAKALGIITREQTKLADAFKDAQTDLDRVLRDMSHTFAGPMTEALTEATRKFTEWYKVNRDWINLGIDKTSQALADNLDKVAVALGVITGAAILGSLSKLAAILGAAKLSTMLGGAGAVISRAGMVGAAGYGGFKAGEWLNDKAVNPLVQWLTGDENSTLGTALYDLLNKDAPESALVPSAGGAPTRAAGSRAGVAVGGADSTIYQDNRKIDININGGNLDEVRRVIREEVNDMAEQSAQDFTSAVRD